MPLLGVRVVDLTQFLSGPFATMHLADLGADVIKIERPTGGDDARAMGPQSDGESWAFQMPNRNKRSLAVDLRAVAGREVVARLVADAHIVVENFRPGVAAKLGLDPAELTAADPELVYCSISGFGQTGPERQRPGFDIIAQGMAGFLRMNGEPGGTPAKFGIAVADLAAGLNAAVAILGAYIGVLRGGKGQYIDVSLLDSGIGLTMWEAGALFGAGEDAHPTGSRHRKIAPYQAYPTADGFVTIGANNQKLWESLCRNVIERPDLIERADYADVSSRIAAVDQLESELSAILAERTTGEWAQRLDRAGVPGGPVLTYAEAMSSPLVQARAMTVTASHPTMGEITVLGPVAKMSATPMVVRSPGPLLGQDSVDVLAEIGCTPAEIDQLIAAGVVRDGRPTGQSGFEAD